MKTEDLLPETAGIEPERYELFAGPLYRFETAGTDGCPSRREFLGTLGAGLVVALALGEARGQEPPDRGRRRKGGGQGGPSEIGAFVHIGEDGAVTVFTGKVEVGQGIRTSLAQVVAEELRVPVGSIRLVMADTDLTPNDGGTSGSRTTPDTGPRLRRVAAAAREVLLDLAARELKEDRGALVAAGGQVSHPPSSRLLAYGALTKGQKLLQPVGENIPLTPPDQWKVIGTPVPRTNGRDLVTGKHRYTSDVSLPGMLHGKVLRPPALGATLASLDETKAKALADTVVVRDGNFAGVAAPDPFRAARALAALGPEWKLPAEPVSDADLFAKFKTGAGDSRGGPSRDDRGNIEEGLTAADKKIEAAYTIAYIAHAPLEPRAAMADWKDGQLTVWTGTQQPLRVRSELAGAFGIPEQRVRVIAPDTGSGYGGKHSGEAAVEAARLAKAAGKPVKLVWTREEEFTWAYFRPGGLIEARAGARSDGTLVAWEFHNYNSGGSAIRTPYDAANQRIQFHQSRSPLRQGSYRALASTANCFARESLMDELAHALSMDPLQFRLKNLKDERLRAVLEAAAERFGWGKTRAEPGRGFGLGCGTEKGSYVATCAEVAVDAPAGQVKVLRAVSAFECGAIVNPDNLRNQVDGCIAMGLGGALFERIRFEEGKITNARFSEYRVPRFGDVPPLETVLVDRKDLPSAGAGETPIIAIAPAVANAIFAATGKRLRSLPLVPDGLKT